MKKIIGLILMFSLPCMSFSQQTVNNNEIIEKYVNAYANQSIQELEPLLSAEFKMMGQVQPMAGKVLEQIIKSLGTVNKYEIAGEEQSGNTMIYNYDIYHNGASLKKRTTTFTINPEGKILNISIEGVGAETKSSKMELKPYDNLPNVINVPFELINNLPIVKAIIDGKEYNMFFDSGASPVILNSAYFKGGKTDDGQQSTSVSQMKGVSGSISSVDFVKIGTFDFAGIKSENADLMLMDLSHLDKDKKIPVHGLIGYNSIKDFDILYDYSAKTIILIKKEHAKDFIDSLNKVHRLTEVEMGQVKHIPYINGIINGKTYVFGIDSGASANLIETSRFDELTSHVKKVKSSDLVGANTEIEKRQHGKIKELTIGGKNFKNVQTVFSNIDHLNASFDVKLDGLIGYPVLSKQKCLVSYHTHKFIFID